MSIGAIVLKYRSWDDVPLVMGVDEAGELLHVHPETIKRWIRAGHLTAMKMGRDYKIARAVVMERLGLDPDTGEVAE